MKNKVRLQATIDKEASEWMNDNFINVSSFINALILKHINTQSIQNEYKEDMKKVLDKEDINTDFGTQE